MFIFLWLLVIAARRFSIIPLKFLYLWSVSAVIDLKQNEAFHQDKTWFDSRLWLLQWKCILSSKLLRIWLVPHSYFHAFSLFLSLLRPSQFTKLPAKRNKRFKMKHRDPFDLHSPLFNTNMAIYANVTMVKEVNWSPFCSAFHPAEIQEWCVFVKWKTKWLLGWAWRQIQSTPFLSQISL